MSFSISAINEELEVLQSIYMEDIKITGNDDRTTAIEMVLHPSTADNENEKYVCLTVCFNIPINYPHALPTFEMSQPRGLSDAHFSSITENLQELVNQHIGETMLFQLIEYIRDSLTDNNRPSCSCAICLEHFKDEDDFLRTECYHYYHSFCFASYIAALQNDKDGNDFKLVCPVCRVELPENQKIYNECQHNKSMLKWTQDKQSYEISDNFKQWRRKCEIIFEKQKKAGGIIDQELEQNRFLIDSTTSIATTSTETEDSSSQPEIYDTIVVLERVCLNDERSRVHQQCNNTHTARHPNSGRTYVKSQKKVKNTIEVKTDGEKTTARTSKPRNKQRSGQSSSTEANSSRTFTEKKSDRNRHDSPKSQPKQEQRDRSRNNRTKANKLSSTNIEREQKQSNNNKKTEEGSSSNNISENNSVKVKRTIRPPPGFT